MGLMVKIHDIDKKQVIIMPRYVLIKEFLTV